MAEDDVIEHLDLQKLTSADQIPGNFDVGLRGGRVAGGVVVLCAHQGNV